MINFFSYCVKKMSFSSSSKGTPPRPVSENYENKTSLQWKPMELGGIPSKIDEYFSLGTYILCIHVVLQAIGSPSCIIIIYVIPFG